MFVFISALTGNLSKNVKRKIEIDRPTDKNTVRIIFLTLSFSIILNANGKRLGQRSNAENKNEYVVIFCKVIESIDSHNNPSMNCCIPKISGNSASGISFFDFTFLSVTTPVALSTPPLIKLTVAEKHMFY